MHFAGYDHDWSEILVRVVLFALSALIEGNQFIHMWA